MISPDPKADPLFNECVLCVKGFVGRGETRVLQVHNQMQAHSREGYPQCQTLPPPFWR
jgi:hypothetical protein